MNLLKLFEDVGLNDIDFESFRKQIENYAESAAAQARLDALHWKQRYENSNELAKSYMKEFEKHGLASKRDAQVVTKVDAKQVTEMMSKVEYTYSTPEGINNVLCIAKLPDGYTLAIGQGSCIYGPNFDNVRGMQVALENAKRMAEDACWQYQGILLREQLIAKGVIHD